MKFPAWYGILAGGVPEFQTALWQIDFHLAAEFSTAIVLLTGGIIMLRSIAWSRSVLLPGLGMGCNSIVKSAGMRSRYK